MISEGYLSNVTLFLLGLWEKLGCKKWGKLLLIRYFSDFLIIKFIKMRKISIKSEKKTSKGD